MDKKHAHEAQDDKTSDRRPSDVRRNSPDCREKAHTENSDDRGKKSWEEDQDDGRDENDQ